MCAQRGLLFKMHRAQNVLVIHKLFIHDVIKSRKRVENEKTQCCLVMYIALHFDFNVSI